MQLLLRRSQRAGTFSGSMIFCLDARVQFTPEERASIQKYRLGNQVIYNSEASQRALDKAQASANQYGGSDWRQIGGQLKGLAFLALASMKLNISIASLERGQHVECKSLDELLGAEDAIMTACENLRGYLDTAATFDGREVVVDFSTETPQVVAVAPALPSSSLATVPPPPAPFAPVVDPHPIAAMITAEAASPAPDEPALFGAPIVRTKSGSKVAADSFAAAGDEGTVNAILTWTAIGTVLIIMVAVLNMCARL